MQLFQPQEIDRERKGLQRYLLGWLDSAGKVIGRIAESDREEMNRDLILEIYGKNVPERDRPEVGREERYLVDRFSSVSEIHTSYERLIFIEHYVRRLSAKTVSVRGSEQLRYHIENWLDEVYLLRERVRSHLRSLEKDYKKDSALGEQAESVGELLRLLPGWMAGAIELRHMHVHEARYSDAELERLSILEIFVLFGNEVIPEAELLRKDAYLASRSKWRSEMKEGNAAAESGLDLMFDALYEIVFLGDGKPIIPQGKRNKGAESNSA